MGRYASDEHFDRPRRRRRGTGLAAPGPIVIALGVAGLLILISFAIRGAGAALLWVGIVLMILGSVWFYAVALSDSVAQFLLCFFVPFYSLFYLVSNWPETKHPFGVNFLGVIILFGCLIAGGIREDMSSDDPPRARPVAGAPREQKEEEWVVAELLRELNSRPQPAPAPDTARPDPTDPANPHPPFDVDPKAKAAGKTVYLAALTPFGFQNSPWRYAVGKYGGRLEHAIVVDKKEYKYGIQAHPPDAGSSCKMSFVPGAQFKRFKGWGGIADHRYEPLGQVIFSIYGDGAQLWESGAVWKAGTAADFDLDVTGVKVLTLETRMKEGSNHGAHAVWLDPWLER